MIDLQNETPLKFADIPSWLEETTGHRPNRSTCHRWRTRGCRGCRLSTSLIGGIRFTSIEALERFFAGATAAADGDHVLITGGMTDEAAIDRAERFLDADWSSQTESNA